jgi:hypothetical protein
MIAPGLANLVTHPQLPPRHRAGPTGEDGAEAGEVDASLGPSRSQLRPVAMT